MKYESRPTYGRQNTRQMHFKKCIQSCCSLGKDGNTYHAHLTTQGPVESGTRDALACYFKNM